MSKTNPVATSFSKKVSTFLLFFFIGTLVVTFALSGFQIGRGAQDAVATVAGDSITIKDYQQQLNQIIRQFSSYMGDKPLSEEQIAQFGLKNQALNNLISQKLALQLARKWDIHISPQQLNEEIQKIPSFQNENKVFDINLYKKVLNLNGYSPQQFESKMLEDLTSQTTFRLLGQFPLPQNYFEHVEKIRETNRKLSIIKISQPSIIDSYKIPSSEVDDFLKDPEKFKQVETLFQSRNAQNLLEGKTIDSEKVKLAEELLRKQIPIEKIKEEQIRIKSLAYAALKENNLKKLQNLSVFKLNILNDVQVDPLSTNIDSIELKDSDYQHIFSTNIGDVFELTDDTTVLLARVSGVNQLPKTAQTKSSNYLQQSFQISQQFMTYSMDNLKKVIKIKQHISLD